jgi:hypothetical protein
MRQTAITMLFAVLSLSCRKDTCGDAETQVTGYLNIGDHSSLEINESTSSGLRLNTIHKIDIDSYESGCVSAVDIRLMKDGLGCELDFSLRLDESGSFMLDSLSFSADSYCPNFDDSLEGDYTFSADSKSVTEYNLPHTIEMESGTEEEVCIANIAYSLWVNAFVESERTGTVETLALGLTFGGDHISKGSPSAQCAR